MPRSGTNSTSAGVRQLDARVLQFTWPEALNRGEKTMGYQISSEAELREFMGEPHELVRAKSAGVITQPFRRFIELSPFVCLGTHDDDGTCDLSPRGDAPGFVHVQDEKTLVLPERPGNKRLDSVVTVEEVLGHCSKAYRRSKLWQSDYVPQSGVPTLTEMMSGHLDLDRTTTDWIDDIIEHDARNNLY
jgi:predicted pyridoxine 5'-phosphate oxidase superfamily flavin-nucleotide-binding protein